MPRDPLMGIWPDGPEGGQRPGAGISGSYQTRKLMALVILLAVAAGIVGFILFDDSSRSTANVGETAPVVSPAPVMTPAEAEPTPPPPPEPSPATAPTPARH